MTIHQPSQHPNDDTLLRHAAGQLSRGAAIITATHLDACAECAARVADFETIGGIMLDEMPALALDEKALTRAMAKLDSAPSKLQSPNAPAARHRAELPQGARMPAALDGYEIGPWRFLAPGMSRSKVRMPQRSDGNVFLLRATRGTAFPVHTHRGVEYTYLLTGSFSDSTGRYRAGDMVEVDDELIHQPVVDSDEDCICLVAIDGHLQLQSRLGRLLQPFLGI
jgi:putative transcriptional regulator